MGVLADRLNSLVFTVHSPDGGVSVTVSNGDHVKPHFQPGAYQRYDEAALAHQLIRLAASAWAESQRRYRAVFSEATGEPFHEERLVRGSMRHRYYEALAATEVEGRSGPGRIRIWTRGLVRWHAVISPGAIRALTEEEFAVELAEAVGSLLANYRTQTLRLKDEYFGLQLVTGR